MRRITRLGGALAAIGLAAGLTLAGTETASATAACPAWDGTQPGNNEDAEALGIAVASPCDIWMAGDIRSSSDNTEHPLIERWTGGGNWAAVPAPAITGELDAVSAVSASSIWAVGADDLGPQSTSGLILHWDGSGWTQMTPQVTVPGNSVLTAVTAVSASDVWAAGEASGQALLEHYDGTSWTQRTVPIPTGATNSQIEGMAATSASDVWAAGEYATGQGPQIPLILHWDGSQWSQVPAPDPAPPGSNSDSYVHAVSASSPDDAWAVGQVGAQTTVILHWDGHTWTQVPSPNPADPSSGGNVLDGVAAVSAHNAWAVGSYQDNDSNIAHYLALHWDGHTWTQLPIPDGGVLDRLLAVAASPSGTVWMGGRSAVQFAGPDRAAVAVAATVPSVVGDTPAAATDAMDSAGLGTTVTTMTTAGNGCGPATNGTIIATTPPAGTFTAPPVTMTFCDFPPVVTVPAVTGLDDSQAQGTITDAGLTVGTVTLSGNCDFPPGTVIRQSPAAGTTASRGTAVNLTEATPPKPHGCAQ